MPPLIWRLLRSGRNNIHQLAVKQPVRSIGVALVLSLVWLLIFGLAFAALKYLDKPDYVPFKPRLLESVIALLFFALTIMVALSDLVVMWGALFRSQSATFQAMLPISHRQLYWNAYIEGGIWAGWALLILALPLIGALAREANDPGLFLLAAAPVLLAFLAVCMSIGSLGALLFARLVPTLRKISKPFLLIGAIILVVAADYVIGDYRGSRQPATFLLEVTGRIGFVEHPLLPSWWTQQALDGALRSDWMHWLHYCGLLVTTAGGIAILAEARAHYRFRQDLDRLSGRPDSHRRGSSRRWRTLPFLPADIALLVAKDLRVFRRDPAQVLQFAMFFGLLGFYIAMLPRIGNAFMFDERWRPIVSVLNLAAIAMALATFTGRFVYPMISLEGRRMWVLALAPWPVQRIVQAKFTFALLVGLPISVALVVTSGVVLDLSPQLIAYEGFLTAGMALGLSAGTLGLGARMADYREDNPAKLVSGYGGTVNLLASLLFVGLLLMGAALPIVAREAWWAWATGIGWSAALIVGWTWIGLATALKAFTNRDIAC